MGQFPLDDELDDVDVKEEDGKCENRCEQESEFACCKFAFQGCLFYAFVNCGNIGKIQYGQYGGYAEDECINI